MAAAGLSRFGEAWRWLADELLALGAPLDLFSAITLSRVEAVAAMLRDRPGLARRRSPGGWSPLHFAARDAGPEIMAALLTAGCNVDSPHPRYLLTPLFWAFEPPNIAFLIEHGADVHHRARHGLTVLHGAAASGSAERIAALLGHGADPGAQTDARQTPWAIAVRCGHREAARLLAAPYRFAGHSSAPNSAAGRRSPT
jgi:ankyrin repeat protein